MALHREGLEDDRRAWHLQRVVGSPTTTSCPARLESRQREPSSHRRRLPSRGPPWLPSLFNSSAASRGFGVDQNLCRTKLRWRPGFSGRRARSRRPRSPSWPRTGCRDGRVHRLQNGDDIAGPAEPTPQRVEVVMPRTTRGAASDTSDGPRECGRAPRRVRSCTPHNHRRKRYRNLSRSSTR